MDNLTTRLAKCIQNSPDDELPDDDLWPYVLDKDSDKVEVPESVQPEAVQKYEDWQTLIQYVASLDPLEDHMYILKMIREAGVDPNRFAIVNV